jgi:hypothetical protein
MTVKEMIQVLNKIEMDKGGNTTVTICDLDNDEDESFHFNRVTGLEVVESNSHVFVAVYTKKHGN